MSQAGDDALQAAAYAEGRKDEAEEVAKLRASHAELLAALKLAYRFMNGGSNMGPGLRHVAHNVASAALINAEKLS